MRKNALHILLLPLAALLLWACGPSGSSFRIKGSFRDMQGGELYIYNLSDDSPRFDTLTVREGEFLYKGEVAETTPFMLVFPNGMEQVIFVGQGQELKYEATANDLKNYVVNGNDENKLMNKFRQETYTQSPSDVLTTAREYINANSESLVAVFLFDYYFVQNNQVSNAEVRSVLKTLKTSQPDNRFLREIEGRLALAEVCSEGKIVPEITLTKRDRTTVNLWKNQKDKDYNLIAFWAAWLTNGYDIGWRIRQLSDEHKMGGKLRVVSISLDVERYRWEESTRADSTSAVEHYCDGLAFESPAAKALGVSNLPFFILTDRSHKVIATTNSIDQIKNELSNRQKD